MWEIGKASLDMRVDYGEAERNERLTGQERVVSYGVYRGLHPPKMSTVPERVLREVCAPGFGVPGRNYLYEAESLVCRVWLKRVFFLFFTP